ncbi:amino acid transporter [Acephala macrosclerotiorum]|nr:amino acid transporter [Acephala macrosclerotiorum]
MSEDAAATRTLKAPVSAITTTIRIDGDESHDRLLRHSPSTHSRKSLDSDNESDLDLLEGAIEEVKDPRKGSLTYLNCVAIVVSLQIGSGIFSTPSEISKHVSSPLLGISVWIIAGILVWTGAASFIELGRRIPQNGGVQEYLRTCYGDAWGFLFSFGYIVIGKPCSVAIISGIFAEHLKSIILPEAWRNEWLNKFVALLGAGLITAVNCWGTNTGASAANGFFLLKVLGLFSIVVVGLVVGVSGKGNDLTVWIPDKVAEDAGSGQPSLWVLVGEYTTAMFGALFTYGGWETANYVAGDMKNPIRDLPRVINSAMVIVMVGFVLANVALYIVVPIDALRERKTVAVTFGIQVFGTIGGIAYSLLVAISCLGALNSSIFAMGRLIVVASERKYVPSFFGDPEHESKEEESFHYRNYLRGWPKPLVSAVMKLIQKTETLRWDHKVPVYALLFNALLSSIYIIFGTFSFLLTFIGIAEYIFLFLAILGLFILRRRPEIGEPIPRTWNINPIVFCVCSAFIVLRGVITDPLQGLALLVFNLAGLGLRRYLVGAGEKDMELSDRVER